MKNLNLSSFVCSPPSKDYNLELSQIDYWESEEWILHGSKKITGKTWKARQNTDCCKIIQLYISGKRTYRQSSIRNKAALRLKEQKSESEKRKRWYQQLEVQNKKWKWKGLKMTLASFQCGLLLLSTVTLIVSGKRHLLPHFKTSSRWFRQMKNNTMKRDFLSSVFAHLFSFSLNLN